MELSPIAQCEMRTNNDKPINGKDMTNQLTIVLLNVADKMVLDLNQLSHKLNP